MTQQHPTSIARTI